MARELFINEPMDIQWLLDVHLTGRDVPEFRSAVISGNEDSPDLIELYEEANPHYLDEPIMVLDFETLNS